MMKKSALILLIIFVSCISDRKEEIPQISENIKFSKDNFVLINEFDIKQISNENDILEVWSEYEWFFNDEKIIINKLNQNLIINYNKITEKIKIYDINNIPRNNIRWLDNKIIIRIEAEEILKNEINFIIKDEETIKKIKLKK